ncbi:clavesin-2 isoform X3 [Cololabis saira]|uniref:clavesin-2 isoform X3 n=1 Tax=Cololabis saira TaxID=129043 RepID=UPI002AD3BB58|nr:clavesin-2 isoform X3 [Cololabis saira]
MMNHLHAGLSAETTEKARLELNENPDTLHQDIQQVRDMIVTRPDIGFLRTDDDFILRFLRARKFDQVETFRLLAQYFQFRQQNLDMFQSFKVDDPGIKRALMDGFPGVLDTPDQQGRKILILFASNWDQSRNSFIDILRAILLSLEVLIENPELQINGFILIIDWSNFSFKQASKLTPNMLKLAIEGLQLLQPECLPSEFGGTLPPYDMGIWARTLLGPDYSDEAEYTLTYDALHVRENGGGGDKDLMKRSQSTMETGSLRQSDRETSTPLLALD